MMAYWQHTKLLPVNTYGSDSIFCHINQSPSVVKPTPINVFLKKANLTVLNTFLIAHMEARPLFPYILCTLAKTFQLFKVTCMLSLSRKTYQSDDNEQSAIQWETAKPSLIM